MLVPASKACTHWFGTWPNISPAVEMALTYSKVYVTGAVVLSKYLLDDDKHAYTFNSLQSVVLSCGDQYLAGGYCLCTLEQEWSFVERTGIEF